MGEVKGRFFISKKEKPCFFCNRRTNLIEIKSEKRICSKECLKKLDDLVTMQRVIYIRFCSFTYDGFDVIDKMFVVDDNMKKLLEKAKASNFAQIFVTLANKTGDYSLLNSNNLDYLIENGEITCFEKNKKPILNKSTKYNCYLNIELKTLNSYLCFQEIELSVTELQDFQNFGLFNKRFN